MARNNRLRLLRDKAGLSQQAIAKEIGISDTAYQNYEHGHRNIPGDVLIRMARLFNTTTDYILDITYHDLQPGKFINVPLTGRIAAGDPIPMDEVEDEREAPAKFKADDPDVFLLRVEGDSVNRVIPDGSFALISPKYKEPNERDLFAVAVNGYDATIKHVKPLANGLMLIPDSHDPTYRPQVFDYNEDDAEEVTIIGKVVWHCMAF